MNTNPEERKALYRQDPILSRYLNRMPSHVVNSFSEIQLEAIRRSIINPERHRVDLRYSIPFLRTYLVILSGPERRSRERLRRDQTRVWSWSNLLFLCGGLAVLMLLAHGLVSLWIDVNDAAARLESRSHATVLPWIKKEADCQGAQREWKDGFCYDSEHSRHFRR